MEIQIMETDDSYFKVNKAFQSRSNYKDMFTSMLSDVPCTDMNLSSVKSCLAIGPGGGECEIEFVKHCAPNVGKFMAVEPDHESVEHLETSLKTSLSGVKSRVFETTLQNWEGLSDPVDLILMFQVLYYFEDDERRELFKKMHDRWLTSDGYVAVALISRNNSSRFDELLGIPWLQWQDIESDLEKAGFTKLYSHEMHTTKDLTNPDESLLSYYMSTDGRPWGKERRSKRDAADDDSSEPPRRDGKGKGKGGPGGKGRRSKRDAADDDSSEPPRKGGKGKGKGELGGKWRRTKRDVTNPDEPLLNYDLSADGWPGGRPPKGRLYKRDVTNPDDSMSAECDGCIRHTSKRDVSVTLSEIRDSVKLLPSGKADDFHKVAVFKRTN